MSLLRKSKDRVYENLAARPCDIQPLIDGIDREIEEVLEEIYGLDEIHRMRQPVYSANLESLAKMSSKAKMGDC